MRKNQLISNQVRFYTWGEPAYSININEVYVCVDAFDIVCVRRRADRHMPPSHTVSPSGDSASPLSSRSVKQTWVIRHKWWQQRGICQRCFQMQLLFNYREHDKGEDWRIESKNTAKPRQIYFFTATYYLLCSIAHHWQSPWSITIRRLFPLIFLNLAACET